ncbi:MAG: SRPBCC family protein [Coriobacteriia bacterium]|nr:SRPBCC family protein [Coriobacteriia bacterium]
MVRVRKSVLIAKPLPEVFAFVADIKKEPLWRSAITSVQHVGGPERGVGARYRMSGSYEGKSGDTVLACTDYVLNERVSYAGGEGPVGADFTYEFRAEGEQTHVAMVVKVDLKGKARLFAGMAEKMLDKFADADVHSLKRLLEKG